MIDVPDLPYATYRTSWRWWASLGMLLVFITIGIGVGFALSPGWSGADLTPGPRDISVAPDTDRMTIFVLGALVAMLVALLIYHFLDPHIRL